TEVLMLAGYDVKKAEVHGMAQRGGSVVSHVRFGSKVHSAIIPEGEADILFGFELLETYRCLPLLGANGKVLANDLKIMPLPVAIGKEQYPARLAEKIIAQVPQSRIVNGLQLAIQAGNDRTVNTVLLGTLATLLDIDLDLWRQAIKKLVPEKFCAVNLKAFESGLTVGF
ncbi:MAG: indolepyruvate oxidoreductase subunit beta, partial [Desulfuromonadaceae bacterium]|nr:indolepyruvate oxidoreductase subunit beta [Desulfuromonadaceae bacterium]